MLGTEVRKYNRSRALPVYLTRDGVWPICLRDILSFEDPLKLVLETR